jgi:hypothetical protein
MTPLAESAQCAFSKRGVILSEAKDPFLSSTVHAAVEGKEFKDPSLRSG